MNNLKMYLRTQARNCFLHIMGIFKVPQPGIHILNGHRIAKENEPSTFRKMLKELSQKVEFIRFEDAVEKIHHHEMPSKPLVAFSFDDGFLEDYEIFAPILEEFGTNAAFFINPNYAEGSQEYINHFNDCIVMTPNKKPMRWEQIIDLHKRGHIIGAHTMDHYMINSTDRKELEYQIVECKKIIEDKLGCTCKYFAFPYGKLSQANNLSIDIACKTYQYVFAQSVYKKYFSFDGKVINRRHFEPFWPIRHMYYFLGCKKKYEE